MAGYASIAMFGNTQQPVDVMVQTGHRTGHRTRSEFDRYHIVSPADLQEASRKLAGLTPEQKKH